MRKFSDLALKHFLESAALYQSVVFDEPDEYEPRKSVWTREVEIYCPGCEQHRPYHDPRPRGRGSGFPVEPLETSDILFIYRCVSCSEHEKKYLVHLDVGEGKVTLQKVGEIPRSPLLRQQELQKLFSSDLENYEKAVICLTNGYGIGAFSYFRRILESNIAKLLDLLAAEATATGSDSEILSAIEELRKESPMSDKIRIANAAVPPHLKPDGVNPLDRMYQVLSEGVHSLSDGECLEKAHTVEHCVRYLASELASRRRHREEFRGKVVSL